METDPHAELAVLAEDVPCHPEAKKDGVAGIRNAQHHRVTDGFHAGGTGRERGIDITTEGVHEGHRLLVAVRFGQGRESGDVGEQEGGPCITHDRAR